jgi:glycosyltransferase involved in cell wall biosynthesis
MRNQLLRDADWAGMAHSLEIRVPFVDPKVFRAIAPLMATAHPPTKQEVAAASAEFLPRALLDRDKTGFSIPVHEWAGGTRLAPGPQRRMRNWAHIVHRPYKQLRALALVSDAFGGHGGIALYNRDFLTSLCAMSRVSGVVAVPRLITQRLENMSPKLDYRTGAANNKLRYLVAVVRLLAADNRFELVLCSHINLLPLALLAKIRCRAPLVMFIYGIDAWRPQPALKRGLLRHVDRFVSISDVTRRKFQDWSHVGADKITILPNAIHSEWYGPGARNPGLVRRYGLEGKTVLMTLGRLVSSERYKGFDEVLDALPELVAEMPDLVYLIVGEGTDRDRLKKKAERLGVASIVRFTGMIPEAEKADHYRLADAYVMPSRGEGFGFVLLEAMACGIPTVASSLDGGREALRDGHLGILVDPSNLEDIRRGIREALKRGRGVPPGGLEFFDFDNFKSRTDRLVADAVCAREPI